MDQSDEPVQISIEGNIGAGKSFLVKHLQEHLNLPGVRLVQEPVGEWERFKNEQGKSILELFYQDTERWGFTFQQMCMLSRALALKQQAKGAQVLLHERSVGADAHVFATHLYNTNKMSSVEFDIYGAWFDTLVDVLGMKRHRVVYLRTDPTLCLKRIQERGRKGEAGITLQYLEALHQLHDEWMLREASSTLVLQKGSVEEYTEAIRQFILEAQRSQSSKA